MSEITLLSRHRVLRLLKVSGKTLDQLIETGVVPMPLYFGSRQRWSRDALIAHLQRRAAESRRAA